MVAVGWVVVEVRCCGRRVSVWGIVCACVVWRGREGANVGDGGGLWEQGSFHRAKQVPVQCVCVDEGFTPSHFTLWGTGFASYGEWQKTT